MKSQICSSQSNILVEEDSTTPLGSSCDIYLEMRVDAGIGLGVSHDPQRNFHKSRRVLRRYQSWLNYQHSTHTMVVGKYQTTAPRNEVGFPSIYVSMRNNDPHNL